MTRTMKWMIVFAGIFASSDATASLCDGMTENFKVSDPNDCSYFYLCNEGQVSNHTRCVEGTLFSQELQLCDFAEKVDCFRPELEHDRRLSTTSKYMKVCEYSNSAYLRQGPEYKFTADNIDPALCTHIHYSRASMHPWFYIKPTDPRDETTEYVYGNFKKVTRLNGPKTMLTIGGPKFNYCNSVGSETCGLFSEMVSTQHNRENFLFDLIPYLSRNGFDGVNIEWLYPVAKGRNKKDVETPEDRENFVELIKDFRTLAFVYANKTGKAPLNISASFGVDDLRSVLTGYDIRNLCAQLDYVTLRSYDFHKYSDGIVNHHAPLYVINEDHEHYGYPMSASTAVDFFIKSGCSPSKIVMGMSGHGRGFELASSADHGFYAQNKGASPPNPAGTNEAGLLSFKEISAMIANGTFTQEFDERRGIPYAYNNQYWIGFENEKSLRLKTDYIKRKGLLGGMFSSMDMDDFTNKRYPLLRAINDEFDR